jgi:hypothetical protein
MKIKRIVEFNGEFNDDKENIKAIEFPIPGRKVGYMLIIGKSSDIFDYFGVEELHGLERSKCYDTPDDAYIAGLCNQFPDDSDRHFLFINEIRIGRSYKDVLLIMHESMHLSLEVHGLNLEGDTEEDAITYGEKVATEICEYLKSIGILEI